MAMLTSRQMTVSKTLCFCYVHHLLLLRWGELRVQGAVAFFKVLGIKNIIYLKTRYMYVCG